MTMFEDSAWPTEWLSFPVLVALQSGQSLRPDILRLIQKEEFHFHL